MAEPHDAVARMRENYTEEHRISSCLWLAEAFNLLSSFGCACFLRNREPVKGSPTFLGAATRGDVGLAEDLRKSASEK